MAESSGVYPSADAVERAVLVRNISPIATSDTLQDFFSFCGTIESHRLRRVPQSQSHAADPASTTQQAVVVFADKRARDNALVMDQSSIVDAVVSIVPVPSAFDFDADSAVDGNAPTRTTSTRTQNSSGAADTNGAAFGGSGGGSGGGGAGSSNDAMGFFGSGFAAMGDLFAGVGTAISSEVEKASRAIDTATDTGVLKSAKDQMALARQRTKDFASDIDQKWHVRENVLSAAEVSKERATAVASVVAESTSQFASQVDRSLKISENTGRLAERARENSAVDSGIRAVTGGFQNFLAQTGLHDAPQEQQAPQRQGDSGGGGGDIAGANNVGSTARDESTS